MATFRKRNNLWQTQVRSRKHGSISKSFHLKSDAQAWAREQESLMQTGQWSKDHNKATTLGDLLCNYKELVTPNKRSHESELRRLTRLINDPISLLRLNEITPLTSQPLEIDGSKMATEPLNMTWSSCVMRGT